MNPEDGVDTEPLDMTAVLRDDALIEDLKDGAPPPDGDPLAALLAAWIRHDVDGER